MGHLCGKLYVCVDGKKKLTMFALNIHLLQSHSMPNNHHICQSYVKTSGKVLSILRVCNNCSDFKTSWESVKTSWKSVKFWAAIIEAYVIYWYNIVYVKYYSTLPAKINSSSAIILVLVYSACLNPLTLFVERPRFLMAVATWLNLFMMRH